MVQALLLKTKDKESAKNKALMLFIKVRYLNTFFLVIKGGGIQKNSYKVERLVLSFDGKINKFFKA